MTDMANLALAGGTPVRSEPFPSWPVWNKGEERALLRVLRSGKWGSLDGSEVRSFEEEFAAYQGARFGICTNSGTTALEIALRAAAIAPGDEVILPAYTFVASATAILAVGAVPIFVDIDPETYNLDPQRVEEVITHRTTAIMPVDFAGRPVDWDALSDIVRRHELKVIEDAAQAWGAEWRGKRIGAFGSAGAFSFQSSKNITCGEGGIILTNDEEIAKLCRSYVNCGRVEGGMWYEHHYLGGNARLTEFQGAILREQLRRYEPMKQKRIENAHYLTQQLREIEGIQPLREDPRITAHANHLYIFRYQKEAFRGCPKNRFVEALQKEGIPASGGYAYPLYRQPLFLKQSFGPRGQTRSVGVDYSCFHLPETERACYEEAVWLPQNVLLGEKKDMDDIVEAIVKIQKFADEIPEE